MNSLILITTLIWILFWFLHGGQGWFLNWCHYQINNYDGDRFMHLFTVAKTLVCLLLPALEPWSSEVEDNCWSPQSQLCLLTALNSCHCYYIMPVWKFQLLHTWKSLTRSLLSLIHVFTIPASSHCRVCFASWSIFFLLHPGGLYL